MRKRTIIKRQEPCVSASACSYKNRASEANFLQKEFEAGRLESESSELRRLCELRHQGYVFTGAKTVKKATLTKLSISIEMVVVRFMGMEKSMTKKEYEDHGSLGTVISTYIKDIKL